MLGGINEDVDATTPSASGSVVAPSRRLRGGNAT